MTQVCQHSVPPLTYWAIFDRYRESDAELEQMCGKRQTRYMRKCRIGAVVLLVALSVSCTLWPEKKNPGWGEATGGEQFERLFWREIKDGDFKELERRMAVNFVLLTPEGPLDRSATLEELQKLKLNDYSLGEFKVTPNRETMTVTYAATLLGTYAGRPLPSTPVRMMTVWQDTGKGWIAIAHAYSSTGQQFSSAK